MEKYVTCESVFRAHPDKICDQIADAILDEYLLKDKDSRVAIEVAIKDDLVLVMGEVTSKAHVNIEKVAWRTLKYIGYFDKFCVLSKVSTQSYDIAKGVDKEGTGDQGIIYGYATNETPSFIPLPFELARDISKKLDKIRKEKYSDVFGVDGKCQVTVRYVDNKPKDIKTIVVSAQTKRDVKLDDAKKIIKEEVLTPLVGDLSKIEVLINPTGSFIKGGPYADSGLTGRKLGVDTYGGEAHNGGGALSGKDYTKVDRSAAYCTRYVAKAIVKSGLASRCEVGVSYAIGVNKPVAISIDTFGTGKKSDEELLNIINKHFDFSPKNIVTELKLKEGTYYPLTKYGHFGNDLYPWENVDGKVKELQAEASA